MQIIVEIRKIRKGGEYGYKSKNRCFKKKDERIWH